MQAQGVATAHTGAEFDYPEDYHMQMPPDAKRARMAGAAAEGEGGKGVSSSAYPCTDGQYAGPGGGGEAHAWEGDGGASSRVAAASTEAAAPAAAAAPVEEADGRGVPPESTEGETK